MSYKSIEMDDETMKSIFPKFKATQLFKVTCGCTYETERMNGYGPDLYELCNTAHALLMMSLRWVWPISQIASRLYDRHMRRSDAEADHRAEAMADGGKDGE